jgi:tripeptide aminopeptidase
MIRSTGGTAIALAALMSGNNHAFAQTDAAAIDTTYQAMLASAPIAKAVSDIKADDARTLEEQKRITEIPAPPFKESVRAGYFLKRFKELGLADASIDGEGNVIGVRKGTACCWRPASATTRAGWPLSSPYSRR